MVLLLMNTIYHNSGEGVKYIIPIKNGDNPLLRIAVCGYEGEHEFPSGWEMIKWKANGGFGNQNPNTNGAINATRERIWFSPHCRRPSDGLFHALNI